MSASSAVDQRYVSGHVFHDAPTNFTLSLAGFEPAADLDTLLRKYEPSVAIALKTIDDMESGKIVNATAVKSESENRPVDHYNWRLEEERVPGKSLGHSLSLWNEVRTWVETVRSGSLAAPDGGKYTDVIFNGIGGSYLGPLMLVVSAHGTDFNAAPGATQRLYFVSNTDPDSFAQAMQRVTLTRTIMVNMSKSGGTAETQSNMDVFNAQLRARGVTHVGAHNVAITTPGSKFDAYAKEHRFLRTFHMDNSTGGRVSVMSAIGMVPCAFAGLDFAQFLRGQSTMDALTRRADARQNPAMLCAIAIDALTNQLGRKNMIVLGYSDSLREFAHYLQQLYMESLGKEYDILGRPQPEGQTVFGGVGTGEQHAFMQQVQKGINDAFVRFVSFSRRSHDYALGGAGSMGRQLLAFVKGTEAALTQNRRSYISTVYDRSDLFNMGMMVALEERIVTVLGAFRSINAYDQPGVQDGKLSALGFLACCNAVEDRIAALAAAPAFAWTGDVTKAATDFAPPSSSLTYVDAIMSDIYANLDIASSYGKLHNKVRVSREFQAGRFVYTIQSRL